MAFQIRTQAQRSGLPKGNYIIHQDREWQVQSISINNSGAVCLKIHDPLRFESQIVTVCNLADLEILLKLKDQNISAEEYLKNKKTEE